MNRTVTWERTGGKTWRVSFNRGPVLSPLGEWMRDSGMDAYLRRFHGSGYTTAPAVTASSGASVWLGIVVRISSLVGGLL